MPVLNVQDFPEDLYAGLKECAAREHTSIAQQTIRAVEGMLERGEKRKSGKGSRIISRESPRERKAIIAKRKALFARIQEDARQLPDDAPSVEEIMREVKEEREERDERIFLLSLGIQP